MQWSVYETSSDAPSGRPKSCVMAGLGGRKIGRVEPQGQPASGGGEAERLATLRWTGRAQVQPRAVRGQMRECVVCSGQRGKFVNTGFQSC